MVEKTTHYLNGLQYFQSRLQFIPISQGYVNATTIRGNYRFNYVYNYLDHLGNVRLSYGRDPQARNEIKILEENHYYPYGLKHTNYNANLNAYKKDNNDQVQLTGTGLSADLINKYKFNGMEYQDELGLNMTAMDYRQYDNTIGRFNSIDALAELSYSYSPFAFGFNNPVYWADPTGLLGEGSSWLDSIWNNSGSGATIWTNDNNGSFSTSNTNLGSGGMVDIGSGVFTGFESLSEVTVYASKSGRWANSAIGTIQSHVYWNSSFYQGFRVRQFSGQIDDLQSMLDGLGTIDPTGIIDGANALGYLARGQRGNAAIAAIGILPYIGDAAKAEKVYSVYHGLDASGAIKYVGITARNPAVRFAEHEAAIETGKEFLRYRTLEKGINLTKEQARVLEQTVINTHGLQKNGGVLLNKINSIAPKNWARYGIK